MEIKKRALMMHNFNSAGLVPEKMNNRSNYDQKKNLKDDDESNLLPKNANRDLNQNENSDSTPINQRLITSNTIGTRFIASDSENKTIKAFSKNK